MHSSTCPGAKGFTTIAGWHRSKAPTDRGWSLCNGGLAARMEAMGGPAATRVIDTPARSDRSHALAEDSSGHGKLRRRELNPGLPRDRRKY